MIRLSIPVWLVLLVLAQGGIRLPVIELLLLLFGLLRFVDLYLCLWLVDFDLDNVF